MLPGGLVADIPLPPASAVLVSLLDANLIFVPLCLSLIIHLLLLLFRVIGRVRYFADWWRMSDGGIFGLTFNHGCIFLDGSKSFNGNVYIIIAP